MILIGLSGKRNVGKSKFADHLVESFGFVRAHPLNGGKAACRTLFRHYGATEEEAHRMTDGDLKNTPSAVLPNNATPRFFMEEFGYFMGVTLGPQWTIGAELDLIEQAAAREGKELRVILESIVYEVDYLRQRGPITVIEIARLQADPTIQAHRTDAAGRDVIPDLKFRNDGEDLAALHRDIDEMMRERFGMEPDRLPEPAF